MSNMNPEIRAGMLLMIAGTMIVPVMDAIAKYLGDSLSPVVITWGRFLFQFLLMGVWLIISRTPSKIPGNLGIHALRGTLLAAATILFFTSLTYLPLVEAIAIFFVQPIILTLISAMFLGETIGWHRRSAVILGFLGVLIVIRPGTVSFTPAAILPVGSAFLYATYIALTRLYSKQTSAVSMQFVSGLFATLLLSAVLMLIGIFDPESSVINRPSLDEWFWLAVIGLVAAIGHLAIVMAMKRAPASLLAPFGYTEIVAATLLGWWIFGEWPDIVAWIGILVIVGSGIYVYWREQRLAN